MQRRFRLEHTAAVSADDAVNAFRDCVARWSVHNQLGDFDFRARHSRLTEITTEILDGAAPATFPASGEFRIPGERTNAQYIEIAVA